MEILKDKWSPALSIRKGKINQRDRDTMRYFLFFFIIYWFILFFVRIIFVSFCCLFLFLLMFSFRTNY
jgi:hypothetical protein